jgi:hypothetical protein
MSYSCTIPRISSKSSNASPVSGEESEYPINLTIDDDKFLLLFITQNKNIISAYRASLSDLYMDYCIIMFICIIPISILSTTHMFKTIYKQ